MFKISDLVNKVDKFRFEYDGFVLEGEYWKYRTNTPNYVKEGTASIPEPLEEGTDEEKKKAREARNKALQDFYGKTLSDTIKSWNAVDDSEQPIPPSADTFAALPLVFTEAFMTYIASLRENPTSPSSPST